MSFQLPSNVTAQRRPISATSYEYILRHSELGQLGQIMLSVCVSGHCRITSLVNGTPGESLTERRRAIFEPLAKLLAEQIKPALTMPSSPAGNDRSVMI
ncbi:MAG TPA: hypothetical protein VI140_02650 [Oxalicibacterium sp.]